MNTCCPRGATATGPRTTPRAFSVVWWVVYEALTWALPTAALALVPKCPACVAAYAALFTGLSLSVTAAVYARWAVIALSVALLVYLIMSRVRRLQPRGGGQSEFSSCNTRS